MTTLLCELRPDRRVVGRFFALAHLAIDPAIGALRRQQAPGKNRIDPQPAVLRERQHPVIPPAENSRLLMMQPEGVSQTDLFQGAKRGPLLFRAHDGAAPE